MANVQLTNTTYNPLFENMCQRFQLQGGITIAQAMLKKATKSPYQPSFEIIASKKAKKHSSSKFLRLAAVAVSLFMFTAVLVGCVQLGSQNEGLFSGMGGVFSQYSSVSDKQAPSQDADVTIYENGENQTTVTTYDKYTFPAFGSLFGGKAEN